MFRFVYVIVVRDMIWNAADIWGAIKLTIKFEKTNVYVNVATEYMYFVIRFMCLLIIIHQNQRIYTIYELLYK